MCRKLLSWAWLTCLLGLPELAVKSVVRSPKVKNAVCVGCCNLVGIIEDVQSDLQTRSSVVKHNFVSLKCMSWVSNSLT